MARASVPVTESRARAIAWDNGLARIEEISRIGDIWEVAGLDYEGAELTLDIDAKDGRVLR